MRSKVKNVLRKILTKETSFDCIAIGAHPDDIEVGTGGLLIKLHDLGCRTGLIILTRGEMGTGGTPDIRSGEIKDAANVMGAQILATLDMGDTNLVDTPENRTILANLFRTYKPRLVLAPYWRGGHGKRTSHPDHLAAGAMAMNAVGYAALKKLSSDTDPHRVEALHHYFLPVDVTPTYVVDITSQYDRWMDCLKAHASQFQNPDKPGNYLWAMETRARHFGSLIGVKYGHGFVTGEPLPIDNPLKLLKE
jgi:bacillithiol biosynthesis deacetylase BshB1